MVFSDDLSMEGATVAGGYVERARAALAAGCDMVLICNNPEGAREVVYGLGDYHNPASQMRLIRLHGKGHVQRAELLNNTRWQQAAREIDALQSQEILALDL